MTREIHRKETVTRNPACFRQLRSKLVALIMSASVISASTAWGAISPGDNDWVGEGNVSEGSNWRGNAVPTTSMRFFKGAYDKTVVFDGAFTVSDFVWVGTDEANAFYNPATGEVHPVIWEVTDPSHGVKTTSASGSIRLADAEDQNAALWIKRGTYKSAGEFSVAPGGAAWVRFDEGEISMAAALQMAKGEGAKARLIIGSGNPARIAKLSVPIDKWGCVCSHAKGDGQITLKAGGELHCANLCSRNYACGLIFDGGALVKDGNVSNRSGYLYSSETNSDRNTDTNIWAEVTANGGLIDVGEFETTLLTILRLAEGAGDGVLTKRGTAKLTIGAVGSRFDGTFRAAEGSLALGRVGPSTKAVVDAGTLSFTGGALAVKTDARTEGMAVPKGKIVLQGNGQLHVKVAADKLVNGQSIQTNVKLNENIEFDSSQSVADVFPPYLEGGFVVTQSVDSEGYVVLTPDDSLPVTADWTGEAGDGNLLNASNWACTNGLGLAVESKLPIRVTTVRINGDCSFNCPTGTAFECGTLSFNVRLSADCDWQGIDFSKVEADGVIDLNGHKLLLSSQALAEQTHLTITDAAETGFDILSYIQSTGTQWIKTSFVPASTDRIEMKVNFNVISGNQALWCARADKLQKQTFSAFLLGDQFRFDHRNSGNAGASISPEPVRYNDYLIVANGSTLEATINGTTYSQAMQTKDSFTVGGPLTIFVSYLHTGDEFSSLANYGQYKLYHFRVYAADGTLKCDLAPARRRSDGKVGLLDRVQTVFYENQVDAPFSAGSVVESDVKGELHMNVPAGETATIGAGNTLTGGFRFVKEGEGTYVPGGTQSYWGGTQIKCGVAKMVNNSTCFGVGRSEVEVDSGAILEMNGTHSFGSNLIKLSGGTFQNTTADLGNGHANFKYVWLTDDSKIDVANSFGFLGGAYSLTTLDLNEHELTVDIAQGKSFWFYNVAVSPGTLTVKGEGAFVIDKTEQKRTEADFVLNCANVTAAVDCDVNGWTVGANTIVSGNGTITVRGTYRPIGDSVSKYVLADRATIDLAERTAVLDVSNKNLAFSDRATIFVKCGNRKIKSDRPVVYWGANQPTNWKTLDFKAPSGERYTVRKGTDGIYIESGVVVFFR